ncbi:hypothetical protein HYE82_32240 [Streptomyces sp. BR123]|uniref:hypothetical protein n=1 Tax=Streptomyces sp. BR123 TaxID=2749828 RepID=UPI0015C4D6E7|nr:hypothetical protein [Streptomyces sp. BR123]NXY98971.1 hypothetical protein [Streptomyces sp. BR123]
MGGREHTRHGRIGHIGHIGRHLSRRALIAVALSVLLGALLLCVRPGEPHAVTAAAGASHAAGATPAPAAPVLHGHGYGRSQAPYAAARVVCVSHDDLPGCSPFSHVTPGVLPAPPPAVPVAAAAADPVARVADAGRARPHGTLARAPDLHALQVLRT